MKKQPNLNDYKAIIFDFDGTLVDSLGLWNKIDKTYLGRFGIKCPENLSKEINGNSFTETAKYFKKRFKIDRTVDEIKQDWIDLSHEIYLKDIPFKPGAPEFLRELKKRNFKIGLATSNHAFTTEAFFKKRGIDFIDSFNYSCDAKKGKPYPYVFLNAAKSLKVDPKDCLAFEDTLEGILAARRAGMTTVAVKDKWSEHNLEKIEELADYSIDDYRELEV